MGDFSLDDILDEIPEEWNSSAGESDNLASLPPDSELGGNSAEETNLLDLTENALDQPAPGQTEDTGNTSMHHLALLTAPTLGQQIASETTTSDPEGTSTALPLGSVPDEEMLSVSNRQASSSMEKNSAVVNTEATDVSKRKVSDTLDISEPKKKRMVEAGNSSFHHFFYIFI